MALTGFGESLTPTWIKQPSQLSLLNSDPRVFSMANTEYKIVPGYFLQSASPAAGNLELPAIPPRFGLIDESANRWDELMKQIRHLNDSSDELTRYKLVFFARHGEGFHNVALAKYGRVAWYAGWSQKDNDDEITWGPDPILTKLGEEQAQIAHEAWKAELANGIPLPEKMYCSPLTRALKTWAITWEGLLPSGYQKPVVREGFREESGFHTCDKRRPRSYIEKQFPQFEIDEDLTEEDVFWDPTGREGRPNAAIRFRKELDRIFADDRENSICITAHVGLLKSFLATVGWPDYELPTGGILPMVLQQTRVE